MIDHETIVERRDESTLPILEPGTLLEPSGVYFDLNHRERGPFKALVGQEAGSGNRYVARRDVEQDVWNQLVEHAIPIEEVSPEPSV